MKTLNKFMLIFGVLFFASVSFAASKGLPAKYELDNQLEKVDSIYKYKFMSWEKVDNQSLVVQTSPSDYYLIVLSSPSTKLPFTETVRIESTNDMVKPGYNNVIVRDNGQTEQYIINKIYKFKDSNQVKEIIAQLTGEKK
jgi:hypothetical protein